MCFNKKESLNVYQGEEQTEEEEEEEEGEERRKIDICLKMVSGETISTDQSRTKSFPPLLHWISIFQVSVSAVNSSMNIKDNCHADPLFPVLAPVPLLC